MMQAKEYFIDAINQIPPEIDKQVSWSMEISDHISGILKQKGMTQRQFAREMKRSEAEISRWLAGRHNFTLATLAKISTLLGEDLVSTQNTH